jgi:CHASE3 domain sensor protein
MALLFLTVVGILSYRGSSQLVENSSHIARSYEIMEKLDGVRLLLKDDESALRGFLLTNNSEFLKPTAGVREKLNSLDDLLFRHGVIFGLETPSHKKVQEQREIVEKLKDLIAARLDWTQALINMAKMDSTSKIAEEVQPDTATGRDLLEESMPAIADVKTGREAAVKLVRLGKGQALSDQINSDIEEIRKIEDKPLEERIAEIRDRAELLSEALAGIHFVYVGTVFFGLILILIGAWFHWMWVRNIWFRLIHLTMILIVVVESIVEFECPLTTWENQLKRCAGLSFDEGGGFIAQWIHTVMSFSAPQWVFNTAYYVFGGLVLASFWLAPPCRRKKLENKTPPDGSARTS